MGQYWLSNFRILPPWDQAAEIMWQWANTTDGFLGKLNRIVQHVTVSKTGRFSWLCLKKKKTKIESIPTSPGTTTPLLVLYWGEGSYLKDGYLKTIHPLLDVPEKTLQGRVKDAHRSIWNILYTKHRISVFCICMSQCFFSQTTVRQSLPDQLLRTPWILSPASALAPLHQSAIVQ